MTVRRNQMMQFEMNDDEGKCYYCADDNIEQVRSDGNEMMH